MKTAISIPDRLFEEAERLASQRGLSRSELYTRAVAEFVEAHKGLGVRERLDAIYGAGAEESALEPGLAALQERSLRRNRSGKRGAW
jgi:metal-responsive CopG/Arc/MetJ family transcriptional regulator